MALDTFVSPKTCNKTHQIPKILDRTFSGGFPPWQLGGESHVYHVEELKRKIETGFDPQQIDHMEVRINIIERHFGFLKVFTVSILV